jgi:hypothetical protein
MPETIRAGIPNDGQVVFRREKSKRRQNRDWRLLRYQSITPIGATSDLCA